LLPIDPATSRRGGFTLVEVVLALGIFAFCIVAMVGLMQVALSSSRDSRVDSSVAGLISNLSADLKSQAPDALEAFDDGERFFDYSGMPVLSGTEFSVHFRARLVAAEPASVAGAFSLSGGTNLRTWAVTVNYPAPQYGRSLRFLVGRRSW